MDITLRQRLETDMKNAMRSGDVLTRDTVRFVLAALKNAEIDHGGPISDKEGNALLQRQAKRMQESIEQFDAAGRTDLADRERKQIAIVNRYLPEPLTDGELDAMVTAAVADAGASSLKDLGAVMKLLTERADGRGDGRRLSAAVRAALGAP